MQLPLATIQQRAPTAPAPPQSAPVDLTLQLRQATQGLDLQIPGYNQLLIHTKHEVHSKYDERLRAERS